MRIPFSLLFLHFFVNWFYTKFSIFSGKGSLDFLFMMILNHCVISFQWHEDRSSDFSRAEIVVMWSSVRQFLPFFINIFFQLCLWPLFHFYYDYAILSVIFFKATLFMYFYVSTFFRMYLFLFLKYLLDINLLWVDLIIYEMVACVNFFSHRLTTISVSYFYTHRIFLLWWTGWSYLLVQSRIDFLLQQTFLVNRCVRLRMMFITVMTEGWLWAIDSFY
jgi:hypothetical protein